MTLRVPAARPRRRQVLECGRASAAFPMAPANPFVVAASLCLEILPHRQPRNHRVQTGFREKAT